MERWGQLCFTQPLAGTSLVLAEGHTIGSGDQHFSLGSGLHTSDHQDPHGSQEGEALPEQGNGCTAGMW